MSVRVFFDRLGEEQAQRAQDYLNSFFGSLPKPDFIGDIVITGLSFGREAPVVRLLDIGEPPSPSSGGAGEEGGGEVGVQVKALVRYSGTARMTIKTELVVNWPRPRFVCLPVTFTVSEFTFSGTALVICRDRQVLLGFEDDGSVDGPLKSLRVDAEIGDSNQQVLKNVKKVEEFIVLQLKKNIKDNAVQPNFVKVPVSPSSEGLEK